nr:phospholipase-like protein [Tanacetum cinerariifolium]
MVRYSGICKLQPPAKLHFPPSGLSSSPFLDRVFPDRVTYPIKKVKGLELVKILTTDELWFGISDHDAVSVCLLLVPTIVFMGREPSENQDSSFQNIDMDANIHSDVHVEEQNSPMMDKEDLLAVFDVKDRITMIEKALKLRYQESSEDSVQQLCYKQHELGGSKSVSAVSNVCHQVVASETHHCPGEDEFGDDNDQEGLVKLVDDLCIKEHISGNVVDAKVVDEKVLDDKVLDEVLDAKVVDEKGQAISRLTATEDQQPPYNPP